MQQPDMPPFSPTSGSSWRSGAGAPSPISSRPPAPPGQQQRQVDELGAAASGSGSGSQDGHEGPTGGGEEGERGGSSSAGNRWPRPETLALIKIRSEMDGAFREAALKGPLWEDVSRRLAEMGYSRSAKKCREKFENVDKYYRRTKDGRAGRGDGKAYRFFTELEALHGAAASARPAAPSLAPTPVSVAPPAPAKVVAPTVAGLSGPSAARLPAEPPPPQPLLFAPQPAAQRTTDAAACEMTTVGDGSFSFGSEDSDGEDTDETTTEGGKRKRRVGGGGGGGGKMMRLFEGLMRQVMERQEAMQQRLLDTIERRDQDRLIREEAWRRQEVARLAREQDALAQERAVAASRDAAVVSFIQRVTGQIVPMPPSTHAPAAFKPPPMQPTPVASAAPAPAPPQHHQAPPPAQPQTHATPTATTAQPQTPKPYAMPAMTLTAQPATPQPQSREIVRVPAPESQEAAGSASPSRWPKAEVHALIQLRTEMESRYQELAPKGPLWEDISAGMRRLGYSRSAKRCKEKWENINKYFKKVKESNKKRPEDSKTCPYYHQLDALYRSKALAGGGVNAPSPRAEAAVNVLAPVPLSQTAPAPAPAHGEHGGKNCSNGNGNGNGCAGNGGGSGGMQMKASNGSTAPTFSVQGAVNGANGMETNKLGLKQETMAKEKMEQPVTMNNNDYGNDRMEDDIDSDSMDDDEEDDFYDDDDVGGAGHNMQAQYSIQFQRQQQQNHNHNGIRPTAPNSGSGNPPAGPAAPASTAAATSGAPFLGMVQ